MTYNSQRYFASAYFPRYFQSGRLRWINGDVVRLGRELRLVGLPNEELQAALQIELRQLSLPLELKTSRLPPETRLLPLPPEPRLERRPKGITS